MLGFALLYRFLHSTCLGWRIVLLPLYRRVSQRARDKYLVWQTVQKLLPDMQRACVMCEGFKCGYCSYAGTEGARLARDQVLVEYERERRERAEQEAIRRATRVLIRTTKVIQKVNQLKARDLQRFVHGYSSLFDGQDDEDND